MNIYIDIFIFCTRLL